MQVTVKIENPFLTKADVLFASIMTGIQELKKASHGQYQPEQNGLLIYVPSAFADQLSEPISYTVTHLLVVDEIHERYPTAIITTSPMPLPVLGTTETAEVIPVAENKVVCMRRLPTECPLACDDYVEVETAKRG